MNQMSLHLTHDVLPFPIHRASPICDSTAMRLKSVLTSVAKGGDNRLVRRNAMRRPSRALLSTILLSLTAASCVSTSYPGGDLGGTIAYCPPTTAGNGSGSSVCNPIPAGLGAPAQWGANP